MKTQTPTTPYTVPVICDGNANEWYIYFEFFHAGKWHERKRREGLNRIKDMKKRRTEAEGLRDAREAWLKLGWNPIIDPEFKLRHIRAKQGKNEMQLKEALEYALSKKKLKKKPKQDYTNMLRFINEVATTTGHSLLDVSEIDRGICLDILDECERIRNFSNHAYNKYASCFRSLITVLVDRRIIDNNPLRDLTAREVGESNKYAAYTSEEKQDIAEHLVKVHYRLFVVMQTIYHTGIRPKEVLALQIQHIDMKERRITIAPEGDGENTKTTNVRRVPINQHLYELLEKMKLHKYPKECFVFGSPLQPGKGNCGAGSTKMENGKLVYGAMRQDYFTPQPTMVSRDTLTKLWQKLIMDPFTGLGIKKHLYAAKHTGTDDKVEAGLELRDVQFLYGHKSERMTERYNKKKRELEAKEEILIKSPAFVILPKLKVV